MGGCPISNKLLADVDWNISQAILQADTAAGQAKDSGRHRIQMVDDAQLSAVQRRRQVAKELEDALRYGLVHPHAQPIVDLRTGAPLSMELLFRARTGVLQGVSTELCINVAEEVGLIDAIGLEMLRGACRLLKEPAIASSELVINVNLSVHQLLREDFPGEVAQLLAAEAVDAQRICLEITESRCLDPDGPSRLLLNRLVGQGFSLALTTSAPATPPCCCAPFPSARSRSTRPLCRSWRFRRKPWPYAGPCWTWQRPTEFRSRLKGWRRGSNARSSRSWGTSAGRAICLLSPHPWKRQPRCCSSCNDGPAVRPRTERRTDLRNEVGQGLRQSTGLRRLG